MKNSRARKTVSCVRCHSGKRKCSLGQPCERCARIGVPCEYKEFWGKERRRLNDNSYGNNSNEDEHDNDNGIDGDIDPDTDPSANATTNSGFSSGDDAGGTNGNYNHNYHDHALQIMPRRAQRHLPSPEWSNPPNLDAITDYDCSDTQSEHNQDAARYPVPERPLINHEDDTAADCLLLLHSLPVHIAPLDSISNLRVLANSPSMLERVPKSYRRIRCAIAAHDLFLPYKICNYYSLRAVDALQPVLATPSIVHLETILMMSYVSLVTCYLDASRPLFFTGIKMAINLNLDTDPEVSLSYLPEIQKNERRKLIKEYRSMLFDPEGIPDQIASICYIAPIVDVICQISRHNKCAPSNFQQLVDPAYRLAFKLQLNEILSQTTAASNTTNGNMIQTSATILDFVASKQPINPIHIMDTYVATLFHNAATCLLNRPCLSLTAFLSMSACIFLNSNNNSDDNSNLKIMSKIQDSLTESTQAALTIARITAWILDDGHVAESLGSSRGGEFHAILDSRDNAATTTPAQFRHKLWEQNSFVAFALFEAAIVLWIATCRTKPCWWQQHLQLTSTQDSIDDDEQQQERQRWNENKAAMLVIRESLTQIQRVINGEWTGREGLSCMIDPLILSVSQMIVEINGGIVVDDDGDDDEGGYAANGQKQQQKFTIGENVVEFLDVSKVRSYHAEPWVFLGLLGLTVNNSVLNWNLYYEEEWRIFWNSLL
ncbi:hypothetical protein HK100_008183 [Physocladia obscura]|uniref:Zn(2)-C6 fungal-type domain-containing protein n=1 Tax=Physocladia obscura TaxID=109957 RepID=A0AAD5XEP3_9FUNG|nr:hypothetical protein HK100_008183 [Physocladia obscura]